MKEEKPVRVQKIIAEHGLASRREAEEWISEGRVTVNGETITLGDKCLPSSDTVVVDGNTLPKKSPRKITVAMNKPKGYVCTNDDPHAKRTVFELVPPDLTESRLFCVGRLDKESEGLLLLTNDGKLQQQLTHPSYNVTKIYAVEIDRPLQQADIPKLRKGIDWEGERLTIDKVFPMKGLGKESWKRLEVTMHHGKKREIRRLFYAFGYEVKRLQRTQIGAFQLKNIPKGAMRVLTGKDIRLLFEQPGGKR